MAIVLASTTWSELWQESRQSASIADPQDAEDRLAICPQQFGTGYKRDIVLQNGIDLTFHRYQLHDDLVCLNRCSEETDCLEWVFNLSSTFEFWDGLYVSDRQHYLVGLLTPGGKSEDLACDRRVEVDIHLTPEVFQRLLGDRLETLPDELQRMLKKDEALPFSPVRTITPAMQLALQQMLDCPYQGAIKQLYLESKSVEVLTLWLEQAMSNNFSPPSPKLHADHVEQIHQAKEILLQKSGNPPSLMALARQVGLNDCTLKRGFQQVFGTTVFGYLHHYRMEQARSLLMKNQLSVTAIAHTVGYKNLCAFSTAFRKKFGVTPRAMQRQ